MRRFLAWAPATTRPARDLAVAPGDDRSGALRPAGPAEAGGPGALPVSAQAGAYAVPIRSRPTAAAVARALLLGLLGLLGFAGVGGALPACTRAEPAPAGAPTEEQRLLPGIVRQQEQRLRAAVWAAETAQDEAAALRLRRRVLTARGRPDLQARGEVGAAAKEAELPALRRYGADEQEALDAYRDRATRAGVWLEGRPPLVDAAGAGSGRRP